MITTSDLLSHGTYESWAASFDRPEKCVAPCGPLSRSPLSFGLRVGVAKRTATCKNLEQCKAAILVPISAPTIPAHTESLRGALTRLQGSIGPKHRCHIPARERR